jgi:hypothetical protein
MPVSQPKRRAKIIGVASLESWSEERRTKQADRQRVIKIDGRFDFHAMLL